MCSTRATEAWQHVMCVVQLARGCWPGRSTNDNVAARSANCDGMRDQGCAMTIAMRMRRDKRRSKKWVSGRSGWQNIDIVSLRNPYYLFFPPPDKDPIYCNTYFTSYIPGSRWPSNSRETRVVSARGTACRLKSRLPASFQSSSPHAWCMRAANITSTKHQNLTQTTHLLHIWWHLKEFFWQLSVQRTSPRMAPSNAGGPLYAKDEKVLCFHHELLYEAKILDFKATDPNDKKNSSYSYRIHYKGWKNT